MDLKLKIKLQHLDLVELPAIGGGVHRRFVLDSGLRLF